MVLPIQLPIRVEDWGNICVVGIVTNGEVWQIVELAFDNVSHLQLTVH